MEPMAVLLTALLARDLANGRRRAWVWVTPLLACGDVASTYLIGVGLAGVLAGRGFRMRGAVLGLLGVTAILIITLGHGNRASGGGLHAYAYLATAGPTGSSLSLFAMAKGIVTHPLRILQALWAKRIDIWANLAPSGLLGVAYVWLLPLSVIVLLADNLWPSWLFASPGFQNVPLYPLLAVGTVAVLGWLAVRRRRTAFLLAGLLAVQAIGWTVVWGSRTPGQWLRVSSASAATLAGIAARIPASAEVIASQGVVGGLSGRSDIHPIFGPGTVPVGRGETWFIITPLEGIETQSTASAAALIGELADVLHATLVTHANGVWAFRWRPPPGVNSITRAGQLCGSPGLGGTAGARHGSEACHDRASRNLARDVDRRQGLRSRRARLAAAARPVSGPGQPVRDRASECGGLERHRQHTARPAERPGHDRGRDGSPTRGCHDCLPGLASIQDGAHSGRTSTRRRWASDWRSGCGPRAAGR